MEKSKNPHQTRHWPITSVERLQPLRIEVGESMLCRDELPSPPIDSERKARLSLTKKHPSCKTNPLNGRSTFLYSSLNESQHDFWNETDLMKSPPLLLPPPLKSAVWPESSVSYCERLHFYK
ncbi:hypothetical protein CDAR_482871 [Caerostris darwini]|uniref:Prolactin receptor n=1 Tax=Caerostris darwini TaxID=1538125 RepID=A0AAV4UYD2_9ARAC|nr:hypothetical protein CDAR_482871 [Caerostris darwini]